MDTIKLVLVDDDEVIHTLVQLMVENYATLRCFSTGQACIENIDSLTPDVIILDVNMPIMDGYELCRALKAREKLQHVPIIFLSSSDSLNSKIKGYEAGAEDYLVKPIDDVELEAKLKCLAELKNKYEKSTYMLASLTNEVVAAKKVALTVFLYL